MWKCCYDIWYSGILAVRGILYLGVAIVSQRQNPHVQCPSWDESATTVISPPPRQGRFRCSWITMQLGRDKANHAVNAFYKARACYTQLLQPRASPSTLCPGIQDPRILQHSIEERSFARTHYKGPKSEVETAETRTRKLSTSISKSVWNLIIF